MHKPRRAGWGLSSGSYPIFWVRLFQPRCGARWPVACGYSRNALESYRPVDAHEAAELKMADDLREMCTDWSVKTPDGFLMGRILPNSVRTILSMIQTRRNERTKQNGDAALRALGRNGRGYAWKRVR